MQKGVHKTLIQRLAQLTEREAVFFLEATDKFVRVAEEKDRSLSPWDVHEMSFLMERLVEETQELIEGYRTNNLENMKDECLDVANLARFVYEKAHNTLKKYGSGQ
jgi:NTP pyrophosphatase (non-canonical NTP hydrolase)